MSDPDAHIRRGDRTVDPNQVEEVLNQHPSIQEAAVIGVPDDYFGEEIGAAVVLVADASPSPQEIVDFVSDRVAAYEHPRHVWFVDALPKGPTGEIARREIHPPLPAASPETVR